MREVIAYIDANYAKPLTVAALARRARLSPFYFIRCFQAVVGTTPHQYLRTRRLERAKHLLATTPMPITEICHVVGFRSLGSFSTLFRRTTGRSPAAYRTASRRPAYVPGCYLRMFRVAK